MEIRNLLMEIREELDSLYRYKAFKAFYRRMGYYEVLEDDVMDLNFKDLIEKIDEVLE